MNNLSMSHYLFPKSEEIIRYLKAYPLIKKDMDEANKIVVNLSNLLKDNSFTDLSSDQRKSFFRLEEINQFIEIIEYVGRDFADKVAIQGQVNMGIIIPLIRLPQLHKEMNSQDRDRLINLLHSALIDCVKEKGILQSKM